MTRIAVLRDSTVAAGPGQFGAVQALAPSVGVDLRPIDVRDAGEIERAVTAFAEGPNGGLVAFGSPGATIHRDLIIMLAAKHRLPAVYSARYFATVGGLISYGHSVFDSAYREAYFVDRILKGAQPADLPVEHPTKFELFVNLKTAKTLGLDIPEAFLLRADKVIE